MPPATPSPPLPAGSPPALPGGASTLPSETREVELPSGHATLTHWSASDLLLTHARWRVTQPTPIPWPAPAAVVLLHVSLRGRTLIAHPHLPEPLSLAAHQHALLYCPQADARFHLDGLDAEAFTVQLPSAHFLSLAATLPEPLRAFAARVRAGQCAVLGPASLPLPMHHVIREVLACRLASSLQPLFLQAKAVELLALQAHAFIQQPAPPLRLSEYDRERIRFARDYLLQHAHLPPTLSELA
ncbi:MAG TPA: hypothetical protein VEI97_05920, partial [bacterium]|nr:hypothetical protein [bacterium]